MWSSQQPGQANHNLPDLQVSSKDVLITGATGFIGRWLAARLLAKGHKVRALVRPDRFPDSRVPEGCHQVPAGLTNVQELVSAIQGANAIIYCAGSVRGRNSTDFATANIKGVQALISAMLQTGDTPPVLLLSSLAASRPQLSDYAFSKHAGELLLKDQTQMPWTILRPPAVYGPGDSEMLPLLKMIQRGWLVHTGPRNQRLSLLHVDDLAGAIIAWLSASHHCLHQTYEIDDGTPGGYNWMAIGEAVCETKPRIFKLPDLILRFSARINLLLSRLLDYSPMLSPGKARELIQPEWLCDNNAFTAASGWKPQLDLKQGARQLFQTLDKESPL